MSGRERGRRKPSPPPPGLRLQDDPLSIDGREAARIGGGRQRLGIDGDGLSAADPRVRLAGRLTGSPIAIKAHLALRGTAAPRRTTAARDPPRSSRPPLSGRLRSHGASSDVDVFVEVDEVRDHLEQRGVDLRAACAAVISTSSPSLRTITGATFSIPRLPPIASFAPGLVIVTSFPCC